MSVESNKSLIRRVFEQGIGQRNLSVIDEAIAPGYVNHDLPAPAPGPAGFKQVVGMFTESFPDMRIRLLDVIGEGDNVVTRGEWTGTHNGPFMGVPATGKSVTVTYIDIWRIENGKAAENWVQMDLLGLMQQLGVVPGR